MTKEEIEKSITESEEYKQEYKMLKTTYGEYLDIWQVAEILDVSRFTALSIAHQRTLPGCKIGLRGVTLPLTSILKFKHCDTQLLEEYLLAIKNPGVSIDELFEEGSVEYRLVRMMALTFKTLYMLECFDNLVDFTYSLKPYYDFFDPIYYPDEEMLFAYFLVIDRKAREGLQDDSKLWKYLVKICKHDIW